MTKTEFFKNPSWILEEFFNKFKGGEINYYRRTSLNLSHQLLSSLESSKKNWPTTFLNHTLSTCVARQLTAWNWSGRFSTHIHCACLVDSPLTYTALVGQAISAGVILTIDRWITGMPVRVLHFYLPMIFGTCWAVFAVVYTKVGGTNYEGDPYIYRVCILLLQSMKVWKYKFEGTISSCIFPHPEILQNFKSSRFLKAYFRRLKNSSRRLKNFLILLEDLLDNFQRGLEELSGQGNRQLAGDQSH